MFALLLKGDNPVDAYLTSECDKFALIEGIVNVYNGKLVHVNQDIYIEGSDPLEFTRFYDGGHHFEGELGYGFGFSIPLIGNVDDGEKLILLLDQRRGFKAPFNLHEGKHRSFYGNIYSEFLENGYSNSPDSLLEGRTAIKAMSVLIKNGMVIIDIGNGTKRHYHSFFNRASNQYLYRLYLEERPSGNKRFFSYINGESTFPARIWTLSPDETLILNWINFSHTVSTTTATASNGQQVTYCLEFKKGKARGPKFEAEFNKQLLKTVYGPHMQNTSFTVHSRSHYLNTIFSIKQIKLPEGSSISVDYDHQERVKSLYLSNKLLYTFAYHDSSTKATDASGAVKSFFFKKRRLIKFQDWNKNYNFIWDKEGQLRTQILKDIKGNEVNKKEYSYDNHGNIINVVLKGNICCSNSNDMYSLKNNYSTDGKNLLLFECHNSDRKISYKYLPGTNLVQRKTTYINEIIVEQESYDYNKNNILIRKTVEDGEKTCRYITEIDPQLDVDLDGMTLPKNIKEYYQDLVSGNKQLIKKIEKKYTHGDLLQEEKIFDSHENYQYSLEYLYDNRRKLLQEKNAIGEIIRYEYDQNFNIVSKEKIDSGKKIIYRYDESNYLIEEIEKFDTGVTLITKHSYDAMGNKIKSIDPFGNATTYEYDPSGKLILETDAEGKSEYRKYDSLGSVVSFIDKNGHETKTTNNIFGSPLEIHYPDGTLKQFKYNLQGHLIFESERDGTIHQYDVDYLGRHLKESTFSSQGEFLRSTENRYQGNHLILEVDPMGNETKYTYDGFGRKSAMIQSSRLIQYEYDSLGRCHKTRSEDRIDVKKHDYLNRIIEERIEDLNGNVHSKVQYEYDIHGNRIIERNYISSEEFSEEKSQYNSHNLPQFKIDSLGNITRFEYLFIDHFEDKAIDPLGRCKNQIYDSQSRVQEIKIINDHGAIKAHTCLFYDGVGNLIKHEEKVINENRSYSWTRAYNSMNQRVAEILNGKNETSFTYKNGALHTTTRPNGVTLTHSYDALRRLQELKSSDKTIHYQYEYDLNDNILLMKDVIASSNTFREYDAHNRVIYEKQATGFEISYAYDTQDRIIEAKYLNQTIAYSYTPTSLRSISKSRNGIFEYAMEQQNNWRGRPVQRLYDGLSINYQWDPLNRCTSIISKDFSQTLQYDGIGNIVVNDIQDPLGQSQSSYIYDTLYQLKGETGSVKNKYSYDSLKNRRAKNQLIYKIDDQNQLISDGEANYTYNQNGYRTQKNDAKYNYDALGRLISLDQEHEKISYQYDPSGRLIKRNETAYIYQFDVELGAVENGLLTQYRLLYGRASYFLEINSEKYIPIRNHRGDIALLLSSSSEPIETYRYDSFGNLQSTDTPRSPWLFSSQRYDFITQLYHFDKRLYDPQIGRWLTPDPEGFVDGPNHYAYVHNNPMIYVDPYGLWTQIVHEFSQGVSRGAVDDTTWGASEVALGEYKPKSMVGTAGYWAGTGASLIANCYTGGTEAKIAAATCRTAYKVFNALSTVISSGKELKAVQHVLNPAKVEQSVQKVAHSAIRGEEKLSAQIVKNDSKYVFPENPNDFLPDLPRDRKGYIYPSDYIRIRPEKHDMKVGEIYNPRHHGQHYHIEGQEIKKLSWNNKKNTYCIEPNNYKRGDGTGFFPGEPFPGS